ncbi:hypothetical protein [Solemya velum gill symbiont]|uniref:hypothetical protein n=1 Tax=Solemya velum gill symbiont TaxID=2340 RepID=UPI0015C2D4F3|nr:hypothetical protein [Solemya velum gill symbiont]
MTSHSSESGGAAETASMAPDEISIPHMRSDDFSSHYASGAILNDPSSDGNY